MRPKKVDSNQSTIVAQLRRIPGISVAHTHILGDGFPDIVVGYDGLNYLVEIKDGKKCKSKKKLTDDELKFHNKWKGSIITAESVDDILRAVLKMKRQ